MTFQCKRCGYETKNKYDYGKHLDRKTLCYPNLSNMSIDELKQEYIDIKRKDFHCEHCTKGFTTSKSRWRHEQLCSKKVDRIEVIEKELQQLKQELKQQAATPSALTHIENKDNNNNNTQINITINKRDFAGGENTSYLDHDLLMDCFRDKDIMSILNELHFNPEHPENQNVKIKNMRHNLMEYIEEGKWKIGKKEYVLRHLVFNGWRVLKEFHKDNMDHVEDICSDQEIQESLRWLNKIYKEDPSILTPLKDETFILMLNNRALLLQKVHEDVL